MKNNPGLVSYDELRRSFVVRKSHLELILEKIRDNTGLANQHVLIVGPRGSGKTTLVRRVAAEIFVDTDLKNKWYPLVFAEEAYEVGTAGEFWLQALFFLGEQAKDQSLIQAYKELLLELDETRLRERALAQLLDFSHKHQKRILIVVENLNTLLGDQLSNDDAWDIRHSLINEPELMLLGTATNEFAAIKNSEQAWFELLTIYKLKALNFNECKALWQSVVKEEVVNEQHIRPIQILTGGNPRLLKILAEFAAKRSFRNLLQELIELIDTHTEYFKNNIDNLPATERKVFVALLDLWQPSTSKEIGESARLNVNKTSSLLKRLIERGAVTEVESSSRKKLYQATERLYNIYYLMRRRGYPANRVHAVVEFMTQFYQGEHYVGMVINIAKEACELPDDQRQDLYLAYEKFIDFAKESDLKNKILASTPKKFFDIPDLPESLRQMVNSQQENQNDLSNTIQENQSDKIILDSTKFMEIIFSPQTQDSLSPEIKKWALEQETFSRKILEKNQTYINLWLYLGIILHATSSFEEAEKSYKTVIELDPKNVLALALLGHLLHYKLFHYEEAETIYRKLIEIKSAVSTNSILINKNSYDLDEDEDENKYKIYVEATLNIAWSWAQLGQLLHENLNRFNEAEAAYRKALELEPNVAWVWAQLAQLFHKKLKHFNEAEFAYKKVIELEPNVAVWTLLGQLLHENLNRFDEAETAYGKALEVIKSSANPSKEIFNIAITAKIFTLKLIHSQNTIKTLEEIYQALDELERDSNFLNITAQILYNIGSETNLLEAEKLAREATNKTGNSFFTYTLASILGAQNRWQEALELSPKFLNTPAKNNKFINDITDFTIAAAANGYAKEILELIEKSEGTTSLEPLIVGLKIFLDMEVITPQEILEVGKDIDQRIRDEKQKVDLQKS